MINFLNTFLSFVITAPPFPPVTILFPLNERQPILANVPACLILFLSFKKDPSASAASSINSKLYFLHIF